MKWAPDPSHSNHNLSNLICSTDSISQNNLWAHQWNFVKIHTHLTLKIMTKSGSNFVHAMTAKLPWHVINPDLIGYLKLWLKRKGLSKDFNYKLINCLWNGSPEPWPLRRRFCCTTAFDGFLDSVTCPSYVNEFLTEAGIYERLTHLPQDKMAAISQTIFSYAFSWMKRFVFWLKFHYNLFLRVQLTTAQHWFR